MRKRIVYLCLSIFFLALIFLASLSSGSTNNQNGDTLMTFINKVFFFGNLSSVSLSGLKHFVGKGICHFLLFALNGLFFYLFMMTFGESKKTLAIVLIYGVFISLLGEFLQFFSSGRFPSLLDSLLDFSGFFLPFFLKRGRKNHLI